MSCSQPLAALPSQSAKPGEQAATAQVPETHDAVALAGRHVAPHAPQCAGSEPSETSQPVEASPSQSPRPALQVDPHWPMAHTATASARVGHAAEHIPQCAALEASSTSQPLAPSLSQSA